MKKIVAVLIVMTAVEISHSQNINWRSIRDDRPSIVQFNVGYDYGVTTQFGYSHAIPMFKPAMVGLDISLPMGNDLIDDFKIKLGMQMEVFEIGGFSATIKIASVFRRYQTELMRIVSFGSDLGVVAGYFRPTWSIAGEFGFDKAIASQLKHSDILRSYFPGIRDGWYVPTGGHFYYGIDAGKTLGESLEFTLRLGATKAQFNDQDAVLPYYLQLGGGVKF